MNVYNLVSSFNPITNESYDGLDSQDQQQTSPAKRRGLNINQASSYNVITNQTYDERMAEPSPVKPGRRTVSNNNSNEEGVHFVFCLFVFRQLYSIHCSIQLDSLLEIFSALQMIRFFFTTIILLHYKD